MQTKTLRQRARAVFAALGAATLLAVAAPVGVGTANAQQVVETSGTALTIERNQGRLIRLQSPAEQIFVADPNIADVQIRSPRLVYIFGKTAGETTFIAVGENEQVLLNSQVIITHNVSRLRSAMTRILPGRQVTISSADGTIILSGDVQTPAEAENARQLAVRFAGEEANVINNLSVSGPNQINLRVRVVEMSRSALRDVGINWSAVIEQGAFVAGIFTGGAAAAVPGALRSNFSTPSQFSLSAVVRLLQSRGMIRVLAEPNLTAVSGQTAHFLAGGEFPIPVPQEGGTITVEFKRFGVSLSFTPVILSGNRINLKVAPEVSQLSTEGSVQVNGFSIPSITTRRAETTVELASGQSLVMAGLLQRSMTGDLSEIPGIGQVPVVGRLFQSERFQRNETELVIIVTPYIVRPNSDQAETARDETSETRPMRPAHQNPERIFASERAGQTNEDTAGRPAQLHGRHGFILE